MRFYIKQKVFSIRDKFRILDESQRELYVVEGKFFSIKNKLELLNINGSQVLHAEKKVLSFMPRYTIFSPHGDALAVVQRKMALRPKFIVEVDNEELQVEGSFFGHSFNVLRSGNVVASIQKKIISWGDTYEIHIADELNVELYLFIVIIIDQVIHEQQKRNHNN